MGVCVLSKYGRTKCGEETRPDGDDGRLLRGWKRSEVLVEERVVEVGLCADGVETASVPCADLLNKVTAEVCAGFVGLGVVEIDLLNDCQRI